MWLSLVFHFKEGIQHPGELHLSTGRDPFYLQFVFFMYSMVFTMTQID